MQLSFITTIGLLSKLRKADSYSFPGSGLFQKRRVYLHEEVYFYISREKENLWGVEIS